MLRTKTALPLAPNHECAPQLAHCPAQHAGHMYFSSPTRACVNLSRVGVGSVLWGAGCAAKRPLICAAAATLRCCLACRLPPSPRQDYPARLPAAATLAQAAATWLLPCPGFSHPAPATWLLLPCSSCCHLATAGYPAPATATRLLPPGCCHPGLAAATRLLPHPSFCHPTAATVVLLLPPGCALLPPCPCLAAVSTANPTTLALLPAVPPPLPPCPAATRLLPLSGTHHAPPCCHCECCPASLHAYVQPNIVTTLS